MTPKVCTAAKSAIVGLSFFAKSASSRSTWLNGGFISGYILFVLILLNVGRMIIAFFGCQGWNRATFQGFSISVIKKQPNTTLPQRGNPITGGAAKLGECGVGLGHFKNEFC